MRRIAGSPPANGRRTVKHDSATILDSDGPLTVRSFGLTERSPVRSANQDQFLIAALARALRVKRTSLPQSKMRYGDERGYLFVVADGVSGQQAGEEASALAVDLIERFVLNSLQWDVQLKGSAEKNGHRTPKSKSSVPVFFGQHLLAELRTALQQADAAICRKAARHPELSGMGTTLTMAYSYRSDLFVAHVGRSEV
jgi:protein phosphatase